MKFRVLGSYGGDSPVCRMTSFLIDSVVAVDAGAITRALTIEEQMAISHVLVTHSHMDHTATLPFLIENTFGTHEEPVSIYAITRVLANIRRHLFNNDTWPDFTRLPNHASPSVQFLKMEAEQTIVISGLAGGDLEVTPVPVNHIVTTMGLVLRQGGRSIIFTSDTGPTERIWEVANQTEDLVALITECSFPNRLQNIADVSLHFSPKSLAEELHKLKRDVPVYLYHFKPPYVDELRDEVAATEMPCAVEELIQDKVYEF